MYTFDGPGADGQKKEPAASFFYQDSLNYVFNVVGKNNVQ